MNLKLEASRRQFLLTDTSKLNISENWVALLARKKHTSNDGVCVLWL
ncbi:hypothetical protein SOVF_147460 [Spinacia oleracea]|nr:hypothetical protein SOVF_147460 [Spinacia oleracea]